MRNLNTVSLSSCNCAFAPMFKAEMEVDEDKVQDER